MIRSIFRWCAMILSASTIFLAPVARAQTITIADTDNDLLSDNAETQIYHSDPLNPDTDGDKLSDGYEVAHGLSPLHPNLTFVQADTDDDGINDDWEIKLGTNLAEKDTDGDGIGDYQEIMIDGTSPTDPLPIRVDKRIEVNIKTFTLTYYFGDTLLDTILVSTGAKGYPTPTGKFTVLQKFPSKDFVGPDYYLPGAKWNLLFTRKRGFGYYIHGAYWHKLFGKRNVSHGCINVAYKDMERLYNFGSVGTKIEIR